MSLARIEKRVFVVGVPRSGTTLLQLLLAAHSRTLSFTESHFFRHSFRMVPGTSSAVMIHDPLPLLEGFLEENDAGASGARIVERFRALLGPRWTLPWRTGVAAGLFLESLDELAMERGRSVWIEKTPAHLRFVPYLEKASDAPTHFIHLIRNGVDVASSLHKASQKWQRAYDLTTAARRWNRDLAFALRRAQSPVDSFVLYEDLTRDPETVMKRLFGDLELPWEPAILERYAEQSERLVTRQETWKAGVDGAIKRSTASRVNLTEEQRAGVAGVLREELYEEARRVVESRNS